MDTSDYPSLPNLNRLHASLATGRRDVEAVVDSQINVIERLFSAAVDEDWSQVAKLSRYLAESKAEVVGTAVVREAQSVMIELSHEPNGPSNRSRHLPKLLAACRAVRKNQSGAT